MGLKKCHFSKGINIILYNDLKEVSMSKRRIVEKGKIPRRTGTGSTGAKVIRKIVEKKKAPPVKRKK